MTLLSRINDIPELCKDNVHIKDDIELLKKINKLIRDGHSKLQIVTDFDHTLTRHTLDNGTTVLTSFGKLGTLYLEDSVVTLPPEQNKSYLPTNFLDTGNFIAAKMAEQRMFRECPSVPQYYKDEDNRLSSIYKPIEADPVMSIEEKTKHMIDWYIAAHDMLKGVTFPRNELKDIGTNMVESFRKGVKDMISWSQRQQVPVLVFSAGLGESVLAALKAANFLLPHVKVVSNFLATDESDKIVGIKGEVIHTYNKNETAIKNTEYYEMVKERSNVILMGDNIGDAGMAEGMEHCDVVIKVGFLGHNAEGNLRNYLNKFDIVLVDDPTMDIVNAILKHVL